MTREIREKVEIDFVIEAVCEMYGETGWTLMDGEVVLDDGTVFEIVDDMTFDTDDENMEEGYGHIDDYV